MTPSPQAVEQHEPCQRIVLSFLLDRSRGVRRGELSGGGASKSALQQILYPRRMDGEIPERAPGRIASFHGAAITPSPAIIVARHRPKLLTQPAASSLKWACEANA